MTEMQDASQLCGSQHPDYPHIRCTEYADAHDGGLLDGGYHVHNSDGASFAWPVEEREACVLRPSTFGSQAVCVKCAEDCECYVCVPDKENE